MGRQPWLTKTLNTGNPLERLDGYRIAFLGKPVQVVARSLALLGADLAQIGPGADVPLNPELISKFDALWVCDDPPGALDVEAVIDFLRTWDGERKPIILVGDSVGRWLRAAPPRGLLVTGPEDVRELATQSGQRWVDAPVVADGHIVTARSSDESGYTIECALELFLIHQRTGETAPPEPGARPSGKPAGAAPPGIPESGS